MNIDAAISPLDLQRLGAAFPPPCIVDVRREAEFVRDPDVVAGALKRSAETIDAWAGALEPWRPVIVYCAQGHAVSAAAAAALTARGCDARVLAGGLDGWRAAGGTTQPFRAPTRWVTRERPKIDRIACPWLIRRFLDPAAEFFYVPNADVRVFAAANRATAYDVPDVDYSHAGAECSFDAFIRRHELHDRALAQLATIVRGADTAVLDLAAQAPGLLAVSLGLSRMFSDDHAMLRWGMLVYDALYAWCREAQDERHDWRPESLRT
jgi:rhodanese-related sulfurtransferase